MGERAAAHAPSTQRSVTLLHRRHCGRLGSSIQFTAAHERGAASSMRALATRPARLGAVGGGSQTPELAGGCSGPAPTLQHCLHQLLEG